MKNTYQHLLIYPTVLLTYLSLSVGVMIPAITTPAHAESPSSQSGTTGRNRNRPSASLSPSSTVSPTTPPPIESSTGATATDKPAAIPESLPEKKDSTSFATFLPWISGLLHVLEFAGLGGLLYLLNRAKNNSAVRERKLSERIANLDKSFKEQDTSVRTLEYNLSDVKKQAAQIQGIERSLSQQQSREMSSPQSYGVAPPVSGSLAAPVAFSEYPFLDLYKQSPETFKSRYSPTVVSESEENFQKRWGGNQNEIILGSDRRGNYWLFSEGSKTYLIPNPKLNVIDANMRTVGSIFDCINYSPNYRSFSIVKPAIVSLHVSATEQQWKLETKGSLEFS
jgi:hypothetical protein